MGRFFLVSVPLVNKHAICIFLTFRVRNVTSLCVGDNLSVRCETDHNFVYVYRKWGEFSFEIRFDAFLQMKAQRLSCATQRATPEIVTNQVTKINKSKAAALLLLGD